MPNKKLTKAKVVELEKIAISHGIKLMNEEGKKKSRFTLISDIKKKTGGDMFDEDTFKIHPQTLPRTEAGDITNEDHKELAGQEIQEIGRAYIERKKTGQARGKHIKSIKLDDKLNTTDAELDKINQEHKTHHDRTTDEIQALYKEGLKTKAESKTRHRNKINEEKRVKERDLLSERDVIARELIKAEKDREVLLGHVDEKQDQGEKAIFKPVTRKNIGDTDLSKKVEGQDYKPTVTLTKLQEVLSRGRNKLIHGNRSKKLVVHPWGKKAIEKNKNAL